MILPVTARMGSILAAFQPVKSHKKCLKLAVSTFENIHCILATNVLLSRNFTSKVVLWNEVMIKSFVFVEKQLSKCHNFRILKT